MPIPPRDLRDLIVADSSLGFTTGVNLFVGPVRPVGGVIPVRSMFINGRSQNLPIRAMGQEDEIRGVLTEVILRWDKYFNGRLKIVAVMDFLLGQTPTGYLDTYTISSEPIQSNTEEGNHLFQANYVMRYIQAAAP